MLGAARTECSLTHDQNQGYYGCGFYGYQDTVLAETGAQLYARCYIEGATDFIFGQRAAAWFDGCDIRVVEASLGFITASGRSSNDTSYYVINNSTVAAADGADVPSGAYYLGRPWREYARVVFQETSMSDVINPAGWSVWSTTNPQTDHVTFGKSPCQFLRIASADIFFPLSQLNMRTVAQVVTAHVQASQAFSMSLC